MLKALILFGSAARGDNSRDSDADMLAVIDGIVPHSLKKNSIEIQFISTSSLNKKARDGDLFALHIAYEGKPIIDNDGTFAKLKEQMRVKRSYSDTRLAATDLAWFILMNKSPFVSADIVNKRIAWCVRTILISNLAEQGRFVFSPRGLNEAFPEAYIRSLISLRRSNSISNARFSNFEKFIHKFGERKEIFYSDVDFRHLFEANKNSLGLKMFSLFFPDELKPKRTPKIFEY